MLDVEAIEIELLANAIKRSVFFIMKNLWIVVSDQNNFEGFWGNFNLWSIKIYWS